MGVSRDAVVVRTPVTRGQPARGPQGSDKPHHNNRERVLRRERSGGNPDESHRRAICQIAGLDEMVESFPPAQAIRALSLHDHRFRIAVPSDVDDERRLAVAGEDRTPATPSTPTGRAQGFRLPSWSCEVNSIARAVEDGSLARNPGHQVQQQPDARPGVGLHGCSAHRSLLS